MRLATRGSALALAQAGLAARALEQAEPGLEVELVPVRTADGSLGDKSRFVKEIEQALLAGEADLAVHSAKDVPGELPEGLMIAGVPERADARDALCVRGASAHDGGPAAAGGEAATPAGTPADAFAALPAGAVVGTSSLRRRAQLLAARPDLEVPELRGNVDTRLRKLAAGDYDAVVLAAAGLARLGRAGEGRPLPAAALVPAPGQGCLALEARTGDERARELAGRVTDRDALVRLTAERALVGALDASCRTPVAAHAELEGGALRVAAFAGMPDGSAWVRDELDGDPADPAALGRAVAERLLAAGAGEVLAAADALA